MGAYANPQGHVVDLADPNALTGSLVPVTKQKLGDKAFKVQNPLVVMNDKRTDVSKVINLTVLSHTTYIRKLQRLGEENKTSKYNIFGPDA